MSDEGKAALKEIVGAILEAKRMKASIGEMVKTRGVLFAPGEYLIEGRLVKVLPLPGKTGKPDGVRVEIGDTPVEVIS